MAIDLSQRVARAIDYVSRWVERNLAKRVEDPHNYGRAVDALLKGAAASNGEVEASVIDGLRDEILSCTDNPLAMPVAHNAIDLREIVQALSELAYTRGDSVCEQRLGLLLDTLLRLTNADGTWHAERVAAETLLVAPGFGDGTDADATTPPRARARTIMALTNLFRLSGDTRALELADRFVRLARTRCFTDDGRLTIHAGTHTHSITGTVHGLADFGWLTGDADTLEHARRIFDNGLAATCSSFGWSIESLGAERVPGRGEINNTGDMIQAAIFLDWPATGATFAPLSECCAAMCFRVSGYEGKRCSNRRARPITPSPAFLMTPTVGGAFLHLPTGTSPIRSSRPRPFSTSPRAASSAFGRRSATPHHVSAVTRD